MIFKIVCRQVLRVERQCVMQVEAESAVEAYEKACDEDFPDGPWAETQSSVENYSYD